MSYNVHKILEAYVQIDYRYIQIDIFQKWSNRVLGISKRANPSKNENRNLSHIQYFYLLYVEESKSISSRKLIFLQIYKFCFIMLESIAILSCDPVYHFTHALQCIKFTLPGKNVRHFENNKKFLE